MGADVSTNAKEGCNCLTLCVPQQPKGGVGHGNVHRGRRSATPDQARRGGRYAHGAQGRALHAGRVRPRRELRGPWRCRAPAGAARCLTLPLSPCQCDELGDQIMHAERELALFKESSTRMVLVTCRPPCAPHPRLPCPALLPAFAPHAGLHQHALRGIQAAARCPMSSALAAPATDQGLQRRKGNGGSPAKRRMDRTATRVG